MLEAEQVLLEAVFEDFELVFLEVLDDLAFAVQDGDVEGDFFDVGVDDESAALLGYVACGGFGDVGVGGADGISVYGQGWWLGWSGLGRQQSDAEKKERCERDPRSQEQDVERPMVFSRNLLAWLAMKSRSFAPLRMTNPLLSRENLGG